FFLSDIGHTFVFYLFIYLFQSVCIVNSVSISFDFLFLLCCLFFQEVIDMSAGCGAKFLVVIVTEQFEGKRLLERHRMVNGALAEEMKEIHALSITKALTPEQWKQQQESEKSQAAA
ncbi:BolA-like protein 2, partial [Capsicum annuum]